MVNNKSFKFIRVNIKNIFLYSAILFCVNIAAQNNQDFFGKIKQAHNENKFYKSIYKNPALMPHYGSYKFSEIKAVYSKSKKEAYRIQQPNKEENFGFEASSYFPLDSTTTLWGDASYTNYNQKNITWNETIDYDLVYPYFSADSIGGNLQNEKYTFLGGYAKSNKKVDYGFSFDYQAVLASRSRDPRVKNTSSNVQFKAGVNLKNTLGSNFGLYGSIQKYTQENDITFYSEISQPPVYHLNGLGYFNNILKGTYLTAFYDSFGYSVGATFSPTQQQDIWLSASIEQLTLDKYMDEEVSTLTSSLKNSSIDVNLVKLFRNNHHNFGVKLSYNALQKEGIESVLSSRSGNTSNGLEVIAQNENYNLKDQTFKLSGLYFSDNTNRLLNITPYISYQQYEEDYFLIRSYQYFDYVNAGITVRYLKNINDKTIVSAFVNAEHKEVIKTNSLLRNDNEVSLSEMIAQNNTILGSNFTNMTINLRLDYSIKPTLNLFFGINSMIAFQSKKTNNLHTFSTGINF